MCVIIVRILDRLVLRVQGKSDEALERHLVDLRAQNEDLIYSGSLSGSGQMQSALAAAVRLASMLSSSQSQDTIQQAMAVLDSVNKKLYGMIDQTESSKNDQERPADVPQGMTSPGDVPRGMTSLESVRGYGDDDGDFEDFGYGVTQGHQQSAIKRPSPPGLGASSQRAAAVPSKRFHFGL